MLEEDLTYIPENLSDSQEYFRPIQWKGSTNEILKIVESMKKTRHESKYESKFKNHTHKEA